MFIQMKEADEYTLVVFHVKLLQVIQTRALGWRYSNQLDWKVQAGSKITYRPKFARDFVFELLIGKRSTLKELDIHLKFGFLEEKVNEKLCPAQEVLRSNSKDQREKIIKLARLP